VFFAGAKGLGTAPARDFVSHGHAADAVKVLAVVTPGHLVTVRVPHTEVRRIALLYEGSAFNESNTYSLSDGAVAVTFHACAPGESPYGAPGGTQFAGGFLVTRPGCYALDVRTASSPAKRITIGFGRPNCG
jgi:hypothetical protein